MAGKQSAFGNKIETITLNSDYEIEVPDNYASYLVTVTYSDQSSIFLVGFWNVITVFSPIVNNLKTISLVGTIGNKKLYLKPTTSGTSFSNVSYKYIKVS